MLQPEYDFEDEECFYDSDEDSQEVELHPSQSEIYDTLFLSKAARFVVACCARGYGKSYVAAVAACTAIVELLELAVRIPNKTVYIIAPTYDQVTDIYYPLIAYELGMEQYAISSSRALGRFVFPGNVELRLLSYEAVERMRGKGAYFVVWDEVSSCKRGIDPKEAWESVIMPTIITRWSNQRALAYGARSAGRALIISTPKGYNFFYEMFNYRERDSNWLSFHYDYTKSPFLDPEEIEKIRNNTDPVKFASEYLASFKESGNNVFYCFDRKVHVRGDLPDIYKPDKDTDTAGETIYVNIDFNVGLQCSSVMVIRGDQVHILDEFQGHPDTEQLAIAVSTKYKGHKIYAHPDPSGRARKSSAPVGRTDFSILQSYGIECLAHSKAPPIIDSVAAVNRMLMTASGKVSMYVHPRCKGVITSLERTKWVDGNPDTAAIDKKESIEHYSDGIRYGIEYQFPIRSGTKTVKRGFGF
jgi:hypothetical protein